MQWVEMNQAVHEARAVMDRADAFVGQMARMIIGKLKSGDVSDYTLKMLKTELRDYNMKTEQWKE